MVGNAHSFPEPVVTFSNCPTNRPKLRVFIYCHNWQRIRKWLHIFYILSTKDLGVVHRVCHVKAPPLKRRVKWGGSVGCNQLNGLLPRHCCTPTRQFAVNISLVPADILAPFWFWKVNSGKHEMLWLAVKALICSSSDWTLQCPLNPAPI